MTPVIELEQCLSNASKTSLRSIDELSWSSLSNEWRLRKIEARKQVDVEER
jgi:hypothetical protein